MVDAIGQLIVVKRQLRNFSAIIWQEQVNYQWDGDDDEGHFVLDQHALWDSSSASSLKQQSAGKDVAPLDTDSEPTCLCSFSLMPSA